MMSQNYLRQDRDSCGSRGCAEEERVGNTAYTCQPGLSLGREWGWFCSLGVSVFSPMAGIAFVIAGKTYKQASIQEKALLS